MAEHAGERQPALSERERKILWAVAEAALPAGDIFPGADRGVLDKVDDFLRVSGPVAATPYKAILWALDAQARLTTLRGFASLAVTRRQELLGRWFDSGMFARRMSLRALLTPLKMAHYNNPQFYRQLGCVYERPAGKPEKQRWMAQVVAGESLSADERVDCDVVVIGTGAGGAVVARELAEQGHAVVMLEEGAFFGRQDFTGQTADMQRLLYRDMGATGALGNTMIPIPVGRTVGGSTTINSGTCFRVPDRVLAKWRNDMGLGEFTPEHLAPYYDRVEDVIGVGANPAKYLGAIARLIAKGCDALGYSHGPLKRNAPECDGQGVCCFGCPTDAKRSMNVSYVPMALKAGAQLFTGVRATTVLTQGGRAVGVVARTAGRRGGRPPGVSLTVHARTVVVACGSLHTPVFLMQNGLANGSGQLGKNLSIHPAIGMAAEFGEQVQGYNAVPQGYSIDEFHDEGILFEGAMFPLDMGASVMPQFGPQFVRLMERYDRVAMFGCMIEDTSRGQVRMVRGRPLPIYFLNDGDVARLKRAVDILGRVYFAAGARRVFSMVHGFGEWRSEADMAGFRHAKLKARDFDITAYHPLGTARMGRDPKTSVVGTDHQVHDVPGLYVTDGSSVPSSLGVNPQVTIMALATRAAEAIGKALERGDDRGSIAA